MAHKVVSTIDIIATSLGSCGRLQGTLLDGLG